MDLAFLDVPLFGFPAAAWLRAGLTALGTLAVCWLVKRLVVRHFARIAQVTRTEADDLIVDLAGRTRLWLLVPAALWFGARWLDAGQGAGPGAVAFLGKAAVVGIAVQLVIWLGSGIDFVVVRYQRRKLGDDAGGQATAAVALRFLGKLAGYSIILLLALENLGVDVTALVTGLGIGGLAVALATQSILKDLFSSLTIAFDQPFAIGDYIAVGDFEGTVENVGLKTTRVRSLSGEQIVIANSDLLASRIRNFQRRQERRHSFTFGVLYETPPELLAKVPGMVREVVEAQSPARFDRAHFKSFGESSLDFEVVYFLPVPDAKVFLDTQQAINLELVRRFEAAGIGFAYPTRTVLLQTEATAGAVPA